MTNTKLAIHLRDILKNERWAKPLLESQQHTPSFQTTPRPLPDPLLPPKLSYTRISMADSKNDPDNDKYNKNRSMEWNFILRISQSYLDNQDIKF